MSVYNVILSQFHKGGVFAEELELSSEDYER